MKAYQWRHFPVIRWKLSFRSTAKKCSIWIVNIIYLRYADILQYVVIVENLQSMLADTWTFFRTSSQDDVVASWQVCYLTADDGDYFGEAFIKSRDDLINEGILQYRAGSRGENLYGYRFDDNPAFEISIRGTSSNCFQVSSCWISHQIIQ